MCLHPPLHDTGPSHCPPIYNPQWKVFLVALFTALGNTLLHCLPQPTGTAGSLPFRLLVSISEMTPKADRFQPIYNI